MTAATAKLDPHGNLFAGAPVSPCRPPIPRLQKRVAVTIAPELEAKILRCYQVEKSRANTIARKLHLHHATVKRVLGQAGLLMTDQHARPSQLDPFLPLIRQTLEKFPAQTTSRLFVKVRERGYSGGPDHFRHVISCHRPTLRAPSSHRLSNTSREQSALITYHKAHTRCASSAPSALRYRSGRMLRATNDLFRCLLTRRLHKPVFSRTGHVNLRSLASIRSNSSAKSFCTFSAGPNARYTSSLSLIECMLI